MIKFNKCSELILYQLNWGHKILNLLKAEKHILCQSLTLPLTTRTRAEIGVDYVDMMSAWSTTTQTCVSVVKDYSDIVSA